MMTGRRVAGFTEGWAKPLSFTTAKAHYYIRSDAGLVVSKCGSSRGLAGRLFHAGTWDRCQRCEDALRRNRAPLPPPR
jgi:hypothetical protein